MFPPPHMLASLVSHRACYATLQLCNPLLVQHPCCTSESHWLGFPLFSQLSSIHFIADSISCSLLAGITRCCAPAPASSSSFILIMLAVAGRQASSSCWQQQTSWHTKTATTTTTITTTGNHGQALGRPRALDGHILSPNPQVHAKP